MEIRIETRSYNQLRYGRPWIALVDFDASAQGRFSWGEWVGDHYNGGAGILIVDAQPGDIIARGQKDYRKPRNSAPRFYVLGQGGELERIGDKGTAYSFYLNKRKAEAGEVEK